MSRPPSVERLLAELLGGQPTDRVGAELADWLTDSPAFRRFATANAPKIRKKLRNAGDAEARADVRTELRVAHLLLGDRRMTLGFEPGGAAGGPDFAVTYRGERPINVEVTRVRRAASPIDPAPAILGKLRQLPSGTANVLVIAVPGPDAAAVDVGTAVRAVRARADRKDEAWLAARGFASTRTFYERFLRLGSVVTFADAAGAEARASLWVNASARIDVPEAAARAIVAALRAT